MPACGECISFGADKLARELEGSNIPVVFLARYDNIQEMRRQGPRINPWGFRMLNVEKILDLDEKLLPYYCIIDERGAVHDIFIPEKSRPSTTNQYLACIKGTGKTANSPQYDDCGEFALISLSCQDSNLERQNQNLLCYHYTTAQSVARKRDKDKQKIVIYNRETEKCPTLAGVQERISLLLHAWSRQAGQRAGRRPAETERLIR